MENGIQNKKNDYEREKNGFYINFFEKRENFWRRRKMRLRLHEYQRFDVRSWAHIQSYSDVSYSAIVKALIFSYVNLDI